MRVGLALGSAVGAGATISTLSQLALNQKAELVAASHLPGTPLSFKNTPPGSNKADGEISTHVICKLGKGSVDGALVRVMYHPDLMAGVLSPGWTFMSEKKLSANGGIDDLVPPGTLKRGLYLIEYDFSGVDAAARRIYSKCPKSGNFNQLNPTGFFLAAHSAITVKVEDEGSQNHLVLSVGDKELTVRPGVRAH